MAPFRSPLLSLPDVYSPPIRRPAFLLVAGGAALALAAGLRSRPAFAKDLTIGFVYVGPKDDYGYNQAHAEDAAAPKGISAIKLIEEEKVPETLMCRRPWKA